MKRVAYQDLIAWKNNPSRKPLLMQGARQVGKTWLLKEFGRTEYESCAYFNFEETPALTKLFDGELNPRHVLETLSAYQGQPITPLKTLLFFDEIQACPKALTSFCTRHFSCI